MSALSCDLHDDDPRWKRPAGQALRVLHDLAHELSNWEFNEGARARINNTVRGQVVLIFNSLVLPECLTVNPQQEAINFLQQVLSETENGPGSRIAAYVMKLIKLAQAGVDLKSLKATDLIDQVNTEAEQARRRLKK